MRVPALKDKDVEKFLVDWDKENERQFSERLSRVRANHSLLLLSPNKIVYEITVTDDGTLIATQVAGIDPFIAREYQGDGSQ